MLAPVAPGHDAMTHVIFRVRRLIRAHARLDVAEYRALMWQELGQVLLCEYAGRELLSRILYLCIADVGIVAGRLSPTGPILMTLVLPPRIELVKVIHAFGRRREQCLPLIVSQGRANTSLP